MRASNKVRCDHRVGNPVVSYILETCPRCLGSGYYGGIDFNFLGKISISSNEKGLAEKIKKVLTEKKRSSGYGFDYDLIRSITTNRELVVKAEVTRCLDYIEKLIKREKSRGIKFNPSEEIQSIDSIRVSTDTSDLRELQVYITLTTKSGTPLSIFQEME